MQALLSPSEKSGPAEPEADGYRQRFYLVRMVGPPPFEPYTFRALAKTFGTMWLRCDVCRRYARLQLAGLHDIDYRTKTFSCSRCGATAYLCVVNPSSETGMEDYRLDEVERPTHHPNAVYRLTVRELHRRVDFSKLGEQPGRKVDPRR